MKSIVGLIMAMCWASQSLAELNWGTTTLVSGLSDTKISNQKGYKKVFTFCQDGQRLTSIAVLPDVLEYLGYRDSNKIPPEVEAAIKVSILKAPEHGTVTTDGLYESNGPYFDDGRTKYEGTDSMSFLVELKEQKFKVIVNLYVTPSGVDGSETLCEYKKYSARETKIVTTSSR